MSLKYKPGDKVLVREDLSYSKMYFMEDGETYDSVVEEMMSLAGKVVTINKASTKYTVLECKSRYNWTDEMFVGYEIPEAKIDNRVYTDEAAESDKSIKDLFDLYNS